MVLETEALRLANDREGAADKGRRAPLRGRRVPVVPEGPRCLGAQQVATGSGGAEGAWAWGLGLLGRRGPPSRLVGRFFSDARV